MVTKITSDTTSANASTPSAFSQLALSKALLDNLDSLGFKTMTPIQAQSLPPILEGRDVIGQAKTGSGKTAAFGLGILHALRVKRFRVQSLVLCPTRELADQVAKEIRRLARAIHNIKVLTLCGGMPFGPQIGSLEHGAHIVVGTPGRVEEHLRKGNLDLAEVSTFVLDEADRMLDMGFAASIDAIIEHTPRQKQTLLFSATFPKEIEQIAQKVQKDAIKIQVAAGHTKQSIAESAYHVEGDDQRLQAVQLLLLKHAPESAVVFCNTKKAVQDVSDALSDAGFSAQALHGDLEQRDRDITITRFANKSVQVMVATDVAARGLDIHALDLVINYHLARDNDVHTHRVGRTGRAGAKGVACHLFSEKERFKIERLQEQSGITWPRSALPDKTLLKQAPPLPEMVTIQIDGGKKQKVRPGDIVGCLTGHQGIDAQAIGTISIFDNSAFVAITFDKVNVALKKIQQGKLKGRSFRVRKIT